jgi:HEAT repeat protein
LAISNSELGAKELLVRLTGDNGTLALDFLNEIDNRVPTKTEAQILKDAYGIVRNPVLSFQLKKSLRLAAFRLKGTKFKVSLDGMEKLLQDQSRLDDLALAVTTVEQVEAFLAADMIRQAGWQNFPAEILPCFCAFFKKHGSIQDSPALQELTRHPDSTVITAALSALEKIDPENLQGIIIPLLDSPLTVVKAQAIQAFYRWNRHQALQHLLKLLFSKNEADVILALHHATYFPYPELESHLIRLMTEIESPPVLMRISQIFKNNANLDLPFRIFWVNRSLEGQHQSLVKGILLGVVRALADKKMIEVSAQDYLNQLKVKVRQAELELIKKSCKIEDDKEIEEADTLLPSIEEKPVAPAEAQTTQPAPVEAARAEIKVPAPFIPDFDKYPQLKDQEKVQFFTKFNAKLFEQHRSTLEKMLDSLSGKELAALINLFGKFAGNEAAPLIKKHLKSDNIDIVCAAIKAAVKIDPETLFLYLPQFMQDKNGKIRMTATRTFVSIDRDRIKGLFSGLLGSSNVKNRTLGISTSMLVDFNIVRESLLKCLAKETSVELLEKLGMVLAANPDRELLYESYKAYRKCRASVKAEFKQVVDMVADKLSIVLNRLNTPEELLEQAEKDFIIEEQEEKVKIEQQEKEAAEAAEAGVTLEQLNEEDKTIQGILTSKNTDGKVTRAKATIIIWTMVAIAWGGAIAMIILKLLTGE